MLKVLFDLVRTLCFFSDIPSLATNGLDVALANFTYLTWNDMIPVGFPQVLEWMLP